MIKDWQRAFQTVKAALMRRGRTAHDADDLLQDAWVRLACYERNQVIDEPEAFLMKVALNLSIDMHRAAVTRGDEVLLEDVVLIDAAPTAEDVLLARERMERLSLCVGRLSEKTRAIFVAYRLDGQTYKQIARDHGVTISTVEKHVARATMQLTTWMEGW
ncbi:RNA polymerase sigma factor [Burkholderiaceae bacterium UC74_6]